MKFSVGHARILKAIGNNCGGDLNKWYVGKSSSTAQIAAFLLAKCAFGLTLYKTFRRHGLQLLAGLIQPGVADAMEGTVDRGRTHAVCIEAQGRREHVLVVPGVRHLPGDRL